jgi:hypothetical protein
MRRLAEPIRKAAGRKENSCGGLKVRDLLDAEPMLLDDGCDEAEPRLEVET